MHRFIQFAALAALLATSAFAAEFASLRNGFSIRHERRKVIDSTTRLYLDSSSSNFVDVATDEIAAFEPAPDPLPAPEPAPPAAKTIDEHIAEASQAHGIDRDFIASVIRSESSRNPRAVSPKGARGLMQLMPKTAEQLGVKDSFDPGANIDGGTRYLRELLEKYNGDAVRALAAYNAGPHRVQQYRGVPPYRETRTYVAKTIREYNRRKRAAQPQTTQRPPAKSNSASSSKPKKKATASAEPVTIRKPA